MKASICALTSASASPASSSWLTGFIGWTFEGQALGPTPGTSDARGTRISSVITDHHAWIAFYDGRANSADNWDERTGDGGPALDGLTARQLSVAQLPDGVRLYWQATRADGANELRTEYVPRRRSPSQS